MNRKVGYSQTITIRKTTALETVSTWRSTGSSRNASYSANSTQTQKEINCIRTVFRKFFFSKLIGSGVDRGVAELFMGHDFALDIAYLHLDDDQLHEHWKKAETEFEFLIDKRQIHEVEAEVKSLTEQNQRLTQQLAAIESRTHILEDKDIEKRLANSKSFKDIVAQAMQEALTEKTRKKSYSS